MKKNITEPWDIKQSDNKPKKLPYKTKQGNIKCKCGNKFFGVKEKEDTCVKCLKDIMTAEHPTKQKASEEIKEAFDFLLDIAEEFYPKYYSSDRIAEINDLYKKLFD